MIQKPRLQNRIASGLIGLALAGSSSLCLAAPSAITNNFNAYSDTNGWSMNFGSGTIGWDANMGVDGTGCLKLTLSAANAANKEIGPLWDLGSQAFSSADYLSVEYDMMVDPTSGWDANFSYGNWQEVLRDGSWSWDSHWVGAVDTAYNVWKHMKFDIPNNAKTYPRLGFALQGAAPYSSDVVVYVDNLVIKPFQNPLIVDTFTNETEVLNNWKAEQRATLSFSTMDAGNSTPPGSLKIVAGYDDTNTGWQEALATINMPFNAARYTFATFDLYIENPNNLTDAGMLTLFTAGWTKIGTATFSVANNVGKWVHYEIPLPATLTSADGLRFQVGGGMKAPLTYYLDNVKVYKPTTAPTLALKKAGAAGVRITMDDNSSQWQRDGISTPADAQGQNLFWNNQPQFPVSYSFTIAEFPDAAQHPGFEAHLYLVNGDTGAGNETSGSPDWGAPDVLQLRVQNGTAGGVVCSVEWKTNAPSANPPAGETYHPVVVNAPSALGTWTLSFSDATHGTVTGPGITATNFTLPQDAVMNNFSPMNSFLHFGMFKNDGANDGHNNQASGIFSALKFSGNPYGYSINETFNGATLTNNYAWRVTRASAVSYNPPGTAWWLNWTLPADGYAVQSAPTVTGPWSDASVTNTYQSGATMYGAVPAAVLPNANNSFFRLARPQ